MATDNKPKGLVDLLLLKGYPRGGDAVKLAESYEARRLALEEVAKAAYRYFYSDGDAYLNGMQLRGAFDALALVPWSPEVAS